MYTAGYAVCITLGITITPVADHPMHEYQSIPLDRRIWTLDRIETLRDELSMDQRLRLLDQLGTMTWIEWTEWLIKNIGGASSHAENSAAQRDKALKSKSAEILLLHHAAMFLTGLNEFARDAGFPLEPYNHKSEKFGYEISAMAAAVKVWEDVDKHFEYSLHWLFDEPSCETSTPFKD